MTDAATGRVPPLLAAAVALALAALVLPATKDGAGVLAMPGLAFAGVAVAVAGVLSYVYPLATIPLTAIAAHLAAVLLIAAVPALSGNAGVGFWCLVVAAWLMAWRLTDALSALEPREAVWRRAIGVAVPVLFGVWILILWQLVVVGFAIPQVLLPAPSQIGARLASSVPTIAADFRQTFLKAVLIGYALGCGSGFVVAILVDRVPFLRRGLLPVGNLVSALPIIGIAPIMVMWFGFDWPSKAAVVVVMTFFPMLVNTVAGLAAAGAMERDLMRTYAASYWQSLLKLRLPAALPFVFTALKINSTLALIGAIVAEFFGTPIVGMGFRISTEVGRMNIDMVWAEIAVAALAGSLFYAAVALVERAFTFWHPSYR